MKKDMDSPFDKESEGMGITDKGGKRGKRHSKRRGRRGRKHGRY